MRKKKMINNELNKWDNFVIWIKSKLYTTLSVENIDKLTDRKEKELKSLEIIKNMMHRDIRKNLNEEFSDYYTEEEIDDMYEEIINES
jgi:hypothetical protein